MQTVETYLGHRHAWREEHGQSWGGEDSLWHTKMGDPEWILPSQPLEGTSPATYMLICKSQILFSPNSVSPFQVPEALPAPLFQTWGPGNWSSSALPCLALSAFSTVELPFQPWKETWIFPWSRGLKTPPGALGLLTLFLPNNSLPWLSWKLIAPLKITHRNHASPFPTPGGMQAMRWPSILLGSHTMNCNSLGPRGGR